MGQENDGLATVEGTIHELGEVQAFGQKGFRKRMMIIISDDSDPNDQYAVYWPITWKGEDVDLAEEFREGSGVRVQLELTGRKWESPAKGTMYFPDLVGKRIILTQESPMPIREPGDEVDEGDVPF